MGDLINQEAVNEVGRLRHCTWGELFRYVTRVRAGLVGKSPPGSLSRASSARETSMIATELSNFSDFSPRELDWPCTGKSFEDMQVEHDRLLSAARR